MNEVQSLLDLPLNTLAALAAGYIGYRLAYTGKDATHAAVDVVFLSLVFAFSARAVSTGLGSLGIATLPAALVAILATACLAAFWRRWLSAWIYRLLRHSGVSNSDRHVTAWDVIRSDAALRPSQLIVARRDGGLVMCADMQEFSACRPPVCIYGADGSIALYVTHQMPPGTTEWENLEVQVAVWGAMITFIPAAEIAAIRVRH